MSLSYPLIFHAGFVDDLTKCTSRSWLWKRQEVLKGLYVSTFCLVASINILLKVQNNPSENALFFQSFKELVTACLVKDPKKRPTAEKLMKHHFFKHARSNDFLARSIVDNLAPLGERFRMLKVSCLSNVLYFSRTRIPSEMSLMSLDFLWCLSCSGKRGWSTCAK